MSTNLWWTPIVHEEPRSGSTGLKWAIEDHYGPGPHTFTETDIYFLRGVESAQYPNTKNEVAESARELIRAIQDSEFGVKVWVA